MLSIEECRKKLGNLAKDMSDQRVEQIRDCLYTLCHNVIDEELSRVKEGLGHQTLS